MPTKRLSKECTRRPRESFRRGRDGNIAPLLALLLAVLLGSVALSFDLGRAYDLNTEMQSAADAIALAAVRAGRIGRSARLAPCRPRRWRKTRRPSPPTARAGRSSTSP